MKLLEPSLDITGDLHILLQFNVLFLARDDLLDGVSLDCHADQVVEECLQVKLDSLDVLRVSQNIDELIIGEEEESREVPTFLCHVVLEPIVTLLEPNIV